MAKRFTKSVVDWAQLAEKAGKHQREKFLPFKSRSDILAKKLAQLPVEPPKLDWNLYKAKIAIPGLVDNFKKSYEGLNIEYPKDNLGPKFDKEEEESKVKIVEFKKKADDEIKKLEAAIAEKEKIPRYTDCSIEETMIYYPEVQKVRFYEEKK